MKANKLIGLIVAIVAVMFILTACGDVESFYYGENAPSRKTATVKQNSVEEQKRELKTAEMGENSGNKEEKLLWLDEAYQKGWLSVEELENIAYYYNKIYSKDNNIEYEESFEPIKKSFEVLDDDICFEIKNIYCEKKNIEDDMSAEVFVDPDYFGDYHDLYVIDITVTCLVNGDPIFFEEYELGGVKFYNYHYIWVYNQG